LAELDLLWKLGFVCNWLGRIEFGHIGFGSIGFSWIGLAILALYASLAGLTARQD